MARREMDDIDQRVARRVLELRTAAGFTQISLGAVLGVTFQQVQKYEKGTNRISAGRLFHIAEAVGKPIQAFFEEN